MPCTKHSFFFKWALIPFQMCMDGIKKLRPRFREYEEKTISIENNFSMCRWVSVCLSIFHVQYLLWLSTFSLKYLAPHCLARALHFLIIMDRRWHTSSIHLKYIMTLGNENIIPGRQKSSAKLWPAKRDGHVPQRQSYTPFIIRLEVDVSCVLFLDHVRWLDTKQNTRNIYLWTDDKLCKS